MERTRRFTAILSKEDDLYVARCPELDIASQGSTVEAARANLAEALRLFLESAGDVELESGQCQEIYVTSIRVRRS